MLHKTFDLIETKADDTGPGTFTALASVFGNVDHVGDRVMPGAFAKTLKGWRESGRPLPIVLSHQWEDPFAMIGKADPRAVVETERGLLVQGTLDIEDNAKAKQVHKLMKEGLLTGWSFGYSIPEGGERLGEDGANELTEIDLVEAGPTLKGANSEAQLQAVKSALVEDEKKALEAVVEMAEPELAVEEPAEPEPDEDVPQEVENVESEKSVPPAKPAAKDQLKNEIDLLRLEIAVGKPLRR